MNGDLTDILQWISILILFVSLKITDKQFKDLKNVIDLILQKIFADERDKNDERSNSKNG